MGFTDCSPEASSKILVTLDLNLDVVLEAINSQVDMIMSIIPLS